VSDRTGSPDFYAYSFSVTASNVVQFELFSTAGSGSAGGATTFAAGTWYFVAGVYDGTKVQVFVNGSAEGYTTAVTGNLIQATGALQLGFQSLQGVLDEIRIYKRSLTPTELVALYNAP
jgi:hypothetical protein